MGNEEWGDGRTGTKNEEWGNEEWKYEEWKYEECVSHLSTSLLMNLSASCFILPLMWLNLNSSSCNNDSSSCAHSCVAVWGNGEWGYDCMWYGYVIGYDCMWYGV